MPAAKIITPGDKFGRWTALEHTETRYYPSGARQHFRMCRCECGKEQWVGEYKLRTGHSRSCGCLQSEVTAERSFKHGHSQRGARSKAYSVWRNMISRCTNPNVPHYPSYGGRGITVCERWLNSFENFLADMGEPPPGLTIDRLNNDYGYYKENCAWKTPLDQALNRGGKRKSVKLTFDGFTLTFKEWAKKLGVDYKMLSARYYKGWPIERILTEPKNNKI
jgi:hypothetical protein